MLKYFYLILIFLKVSGCTPEQKENPVEVVNKSLISDLVYKAARGDGAANDSLSGLIDYNLPMNENYTSLEIEKGNSSNGTMFFAVKLQHENPIYNVFAIYDSTLTLFLLDRSINGYLSVEFLEQAEMQFFLLTEQFSAKDTLQLERLTLYRVKENSVVMAFRGFTKLTMPANEYLQVINEISESRIKTEITSLKNSPVNNKGDVFSLNRSTGSYLSKDNVFDSFVSQQVENFRNQLRKPQISDSKSAMESVGVFEELDTLSNSSNTRTGYGYALTLDENWKDIKITITDNLREKRRGVRHINSKLGANISVVKLENGESAEELVSPPLPHVMEGTYRVRYSDKIESDKNYLIFFEYSCGEEKYMMIMSVPIYTYAENLETYNYIINSFTINC
jgi:hypothetical protein